MKLNKLYTFRVETLKSYITDVKTMAGSEKQARLQVYDYLLSNNLINDNLYYRLKLMRVKDEESDT